MPDLISTIDQLKGAWDASKPVLEGNPTIVENSAPGCTVEQIDEAVKTVIKWASKVRSPHGFRPIFPLAKIHLSAAMVQLVQHAQNVQGNPAAHFPAFFTQLVAVLTPLTAASVFADKAEANKIVSDLSAELSQHIALMETAQSELQEKILLLEESVKAAELIDEKAQAAAIASSKIEAAITQVEEKNSEADSHLKSIEASQSEVETHTLKLDALIKQNEALETQLQIQAKTLQAITAKAEEQQQLLDSLLPRGTSAGLAASFNQQRMRFGLSQIGWAICFISTVVALAVFAWTIKITLPTGSTSEIWSYLLFRVPLAAPLVWLGWFSAIQYGNVLRLKEDYAFKEATSMAFAGYRDHMEHLRDVEGADGGTALNQLALVTISILGNDPLRLLQQQSNDASPLDRLSFLLRKQSQNTQGEKEIQRQ